MDTRFLLYATVTLLVLGSLAHRIAPPERDAVLGCALTYVYDGDTVALTCAGEDQTARLKGIDTPETKSPRCDAEKAHGDLATLRLRALVEEGKIDLDAFGHDKYGRTLVHVLVDGKNVNDTLVDEGLAVTYTGGKRINWCDRLEGQT